MQEEKPPHQYIKVDPIAFNATPGAHKTQEEVDAEVEEALQLLKQAEILGMAERFKMDARAQLNKNNKDKRRKVEKIRKITRKRQRRNKQTMRRRRK